MSVSLTIRKAKTQDHEFIWYIIKNVIQSGDTYVYHPDSSKAKMLAIWCSNEKHTYVAVKDERIVGTFWIKANQPDLGSHIANAAFMVNTDQQGKGIGRSMALRAMKEAKELGYHAMQFNLIICSNANAIRLWENLGFKIVGEIPHAFQHKFKGLVNALVMYKKL